MLATTEQVKEIYRHPNADRLDFAKVLGYECIVGRDQFKAGAIIVLIQPDTVLPADRAWTSEALKYTSKGRVKAQRLRGEWSMGLVMPVSILQESGRACFELGEEVADLLGIVAYEAPPPKNVQANSED